ncbi:hypothetical protein NF419_04865 [Streptococcus suis]|nr:hypothetical protein [Streptococcus suis]MCQ8265249.1 hypothetical protein [Streptococcus suis]
MRNTLNHITRIVGGIALIMALNGCTLADEYNQWATEQPVSSETGAPRTAEEAAVEAQFEPLFEFLAAEKKDFSNVSKFISRLTVRNKSEIDQTNNEIEENVLVLKSSDTESQAFSGYFKERQNEQGLKYNDEGVKYDVRLVENEVVFENTTSKKFIHDLYFSIVATTDIEKGTVTSYSTDHPETELTTLMYTLSPDLSIFRNLVQQYNIKDTITGATLSLSKSGTSEYDAQFYLYTDKKTYTLGTFVVFSN